MNVQPIVEGHGDVQAVPVLLRRLFTEAGLFDIGVARPIRRKRSELHTQTGVQTAVRLALLQPQCASILLLFDSDDSCPKDLAPMILGWAQAVAGAMPCFAVLAYREYETWFLAAIESLRGKCGIRADAATMANFEGRRGAKEALEEYMPKNRSYHETADQASLTASFDLAAAYTFSRSFRKMVKCVGDLAGALGTTCGAWPPPGWAQNVT